MFKVSLINMPFTALEAPSFGLTQISAALNQHFQGRIFVDQIRYINQDFGHYLGIDLYKFMCSSGVALNSGIGDWFFRQMAFPAAPDNSEVYYLRYLPMLTKELRENKRKIEEKRAGLDDYLEGLVEKYRLDEMDLVGFTSMFSQNVGSFALARKVKQRNPKVMVVMGGANCESPMGQEIIKHVEAVDYVFSGPALKSFPTLIEHCLAGEREQCEQIRGVFSRANVAHPPSIIGEEVDINQVLELDYDSFLETSRQNFPEREVKPYLMFETSRGCWWGEKAHCTFCGLNGLTMNYRSMQPEKAISYINSLLASYGSECSEFECVDNIMPTNYPAEVFPHVQAPAHVSLFYEVKADLTEEAMQSISQARVKTIQPGIEALATSTLKLMKKGTTAFQNIAFLKNCLLYDLSPRWNVLVGFPGEDEEVYRKYLEDFPLLVHLPPPVAMARIVFDRYSPYHVEAEKYGLRLQPSDHYSLTYPFSKESLSNIAYHFVDGNFKAEYVHNMIKWVTKVQDLASQWRSLWKNDATLPKLYLKKHGQETLVHDTRGPELIEHPLNQTHVGLLAQLEKPKRISQLGMELPGVKAAEIEAEMQWLKQRGLVFQEGDRFLSLVLPRETFRSSLDLSLTAPDIQQLVLKDS